MLFWSITSRLETLGTGQNGDLCWSASQLCCTAEAQLLQGFQGSINPHDLVHLAQTVSGVTDPEGICFHFSELQNDARKKNNPEKWEEERTFMVLFWFHYQRACGARWVVGVIWQKGRHNSNLLVWATTWKCCSTWSTHYRSPGLSLMRRLCSTALLTGTSAWKEASGSVESVWDRRSNTSGLLTWRMYPGL